MSVGFIFYLNLMQVALEDPKRFRIELTFSRGADLSPLEVLVMSSLFCYCLCKVVFRNE